MTQTWRPSTSPWPVTTPSAGALSEPSRSLASKPSSTNVPGSKSRSIRSRTVRLPRSCCLAILSTPPIARCFLRLARNSPTCASKSSVIGRILLADQQVLSVAPAVKEAVHVALRQPLALRGLGRLPQAMLVLDDRQPLQRQRLAATVPQAEAELHVGDAVEAEPRIEAPCRQRVGAPECHAVTLDRVHLGAWALGELLHGAFAAQAERSRDGYRGIPERLEKRTHGVARELDARVEQDDVLPGRPLDARVDGGREAQRRIKCDHAQPLSHAVPQPSGDARIAGVVDDQRFEVGPGVGEHREQPALRIGLPAVDDGENRDPTRRRLRFGGGRSLDRLQLAAGGAVDDVPPAVAELRADRVGGREVSGSPALDARVEKSLSFLPIRSFWL